MRDLTRSDVCRDISAFSWPVAKMALGVPRPMHREPSEPEAVLYFDFAADDEEGLRYKEKTARRAIRDNPVPVAGVASIDELVAVAPALRRFADFPVTLDFMLDYPGGGLTWVGTYGPTSRWEEGATHCRDLMLERGFPPTMVSRPMKGGHYGVLRPICCFDRGDPDELRRVRELNLELLELLVGLGYIPYKAPDWAVRELAKRAHPGFVDLLERVRAALDPQGIMNPSRLPFATR
jgi:FAD/FMN-containing dehydrogenase